MMGQIKTPSILSNFLLPLAEFRHSFSPLIIIRSEFWEGEGMEVGKREMGEKGDKEG